MTEGLGTISSTEYHAKPGCNHSFLVKMEQESPAHAMHQKLSKESTSSMNFGSAFHDAILLPEFFKEHWAVKGGCCGLTKQEKPCSKSGQVRVEGLWFCQIHAPLGPYDEVDTLTAQEFELIETMKSKLMEHPKARRFLGYDPDAKRFGPDLYEQSFFWTDPETGILCKGRADLLSGYKPVIVDIKTTGKSAQEDEFAKHVINYGYDLQAAHYIEGIREIGHYDEEPRFVIVVIETKAPHGIGVYEIDAGFLEARRAFERLSKLKRQYAECLERNEWHGYDERVKTLTCPRWARMED